MSEATIPIKELMEKTEQWLLGQGYKKSTLGFYRATWNRFLSYSASPAYSRETAEQFLLQYFGVDVHAIDQTLDGRMRHARRHMNALDEIFRTGTVCRRKVYGVASIDDDCFDKFFSDYLSYCKMQNFSRSWMDNTIAALRLFLLAVHSSNTQNIKSINAETINCFSTAMSNASEICMNVRRARCRQVGAYLHWLYDHKYTDLDYSLQLPNFKRTAPQIPQVWSPEEIDKILAVIDTANPVGRRNYAIFAKFAYTQDGISYVPDTSKLKNSSTFTPHIFTVEEIRRLLYAADNLPVRNNAPTRHLVIPAVIRLLYCCGFRIGEVLRLRVKDVDLDTGIITVHNGKGGKDRLVPVHNSVIEYLRSYSAQLPDEREWFFPSACGHYSIKTIYDNFRELLFACNIPHTGNGPRVHDFRHTFAVHTLEKQLSDGYDPMVIVPRLAAYLGHKSYRETCWYIHLTVASFPELSQKLDRAFVGIIPVGGETDEEN